MFEGLGCFESWYGFGGWVQALMVWRLGGLYVAGAGSVESWYRAGSCWREEEGRGQRQQS